MTTEVDVLIAWERRERNGADRVPWLVNTIVAPRHLTQGVCTVLVTDEVDTTSI